MTYRQPKPDDQKLTQKAYELLMGVVELHPEIEPSLWIGACLSAIASNFEANGMPYEIFLDDMHQAIDFYKHYWEQDPI